jgi:hypothetical protein
MEKQSTTRGVTLKPKAPPAAVLRAGMRAKQVMPAGNGHVTLFEDKIRVRDTSDDSEELPRRYTLTRDDRAAELLLSIGPEYDEEALARPRTRKMRDEVLAELTGAEQPRLEVSVLAGSDKLTGRQAGPAARRRIFEKELPLVLAVLRYGDRFFFERRVELDEAPVVVEFRCSDPRYGGRQAYGRISDYRVTQIAGESRRLLAGVVALAAVGIGALVWSRRRK